MITQSKKVIKSNFNFQKDALNFVNWSPSILTKKSLFFLCFITLTFINHFEVIRVAVEVHEIKTQKYENLIEEISEFVKLNG